MRRVGCALVVLASGIATGCMNSATLPTAIFPVASQTGCPFAVHLAPPPYGTNPTVDWEPYAINKVMPEYPAIAREANVDGTVLLVALVCEHGHVVDVRVATSIPMLDAAAVSAVRQWTFRPARRGLKAVPFWTDVPVRFSLH